MRQVFHGSARTTAAIRRSTIQHSQEGLQSLTTRYSINPKTVAKWRKRPGVRDARMGPARHSLQVALPVGEQARPVALPSGPVARRIVLE